VADVHLRRVTPATAAECRALRVDPSQERFIATNAKSLAQAERNPDLVPLAIYEAAARGYPQPSTPMIGFVMYEVDVGVGSILRLMIDRAHQRQGYGRAALREVIRRLQLHPDVEMVITSHRHDNTVVAALFHSEGFIPWEIERTFPVTPGEVYLRLPPRRNA
jgi:diamine N-acetyltransferase